MRMLLVVLLSLPANAYALAKGKIVIIDTGSNFKTGYKQCNENYNTIRATDDDDLNHGTNINFILQRMKSNKYCIVNIKAIVRPTGAKGYFGQMTDSALSLVLNIKNVKYLNLSWGGDGFDARELNLIKRIIAKGVKVYVAAGNEDQYLDLNNCNFYPACYRKFLKKNFYVIGAWDKNERMMNKTNYGTVIDKWALGEHTGHNGKKIKGTSFAVPQAIMEDIDGTSKR